jgi:outer membrane biogenesis lipoprotein LolB
MCLTRAAHLPDDPFTLAIASALTAGVAATLEKPTDDKEKEKTWQQNTR